MMKHIFRLFCLIGINLISEAAFATKRALLTTNSFDKGDLAPKITTNDTRRVATNLVSLGLRVQLYPSGAKLENLVDKITNGITRFKFGICR